MGAEMSDLALYGNDLFGDPIVRRGIGPVSQRFTMPPFSILDARSAEWQERKRAWSSMGIAGELGRSAKAYNIHSWVDAQNVDGENQPGMHGDGTSIFDPVLCELACRWFCPNGGQIVDPFAGGSVRGVVASALGRDYWGCDLRREQVDANEQQAKEIIPTYLPEWVCGDSLETLDSAPQADLVFSCPPYGDLEIYSDDPADLSNMEWHTFLAAYKRIILKSVKRMKQDSFACFVVGDFRDKKGFYRNFVSETIAAFVDCGANLYNEAILVTPVGTAAMRVTKQFESGRKLAKTHQNVLVFCKGDWKQAARKCNV